MIKDQVFKVNSLSLLTPLISFLQPVLKLPESSSQVRLSVNFFQYFGFEMDTTIEGKPVRRSEIFLQNKPRYST